MQSVFIEVNLTLNNFTGNQHDIKMTIVFQNNSLCIFDKVLKQHISFVSFNMVRGNNSSLDVQTSKQPSFLKLKFHNKKLNTNIT